MNAFVADMRENKKRKTPRDVPGMVDWTTVGQSPNVAMPRQQTHVPPAQGFRGGPQPQQEGYCSNRRKRWNNLWYCYSCGYDVDHSGENCPNPKANHIPNVPRKLAHTVPGASMSGQHKALPDGTGQGKGWLLTQAANKGFYTMAAQGQQPWATVFGQQLQGGQGGGGNNSRNRRRNNRNGNRAGANNFGSSNYGNYGNNNGRVNWGQFQNQGNRFGS